MDFSNSGNISRSVFTAYSDVQTATSTISSTSGDLTVTSSFPGSLSLAPWTRSSYALTGLSAQSDPITTIPSSMVVSPSSSSVEYVTAASQKSLVHSLSSVASGPDPLSVPTTDGGYSDSMKLTITLGSSSKIKGPDAKHSQSASSSPSSIMTRTRTDNVLVSTLSTGSGSSPESLTVSTFSTATSSLPPSLASTVSKTSVTSFSAEKASPSQIYVRVTSGVDGNNNGADNGIRTYIVMETVSGKLVTATSTTEASTPTDTSANPISGSLQNQAKSNGLSTGSKVAIGVTVPIGILGILGMALVIYLWLRRRHNLQARAQSPPASYDDDEKPSTPDTMFHIRRHSKRDSYNAYSAHNMF